MYKLISLIVTLRSGANQRNQIVTFSVFSFLQPIFFCIGVDVSRLRWVLSILLFAISSWVIVTPVSRSLLTSWYIIDKCASLYLFLLPVIRFSMGLLVPSDVPQELTVPFNLHLINVISMPYQTTTTRNAACPTSRHICSLRPPPTSLLLTLTADSGATVIMFFTLKQTWV